MSRLFDVSKYDPIAGEQFFLDANIWLYLFCPIGGYRKDEVDKYNKFFLKLKTKKARIYTSLMVLSEFFNAYMRIDFKILQISDPVKYKDFKKDYRTTNDYKILANQVCSLMKNKISKSSIRIDDGFSMVNIEEILDCGTNYDFNDNCYAIICKPKKIKIVTNDKDFLYNFKEVDIVTKWK